MVDNMKDLWEGVCFELFQDNAFTQVFFNDFVKNKRVLLISLPRYIDQMHYRYGRYIVDLQEKYINQFDGIYIINSYNRLMISACNTYFPEIAGIHDKNGKFLSSLNRNINTNYPDIENLKKNWKYQVIINDGKVEFFVDYMFLRDKEKIIQTILSKHATDPKDDHYNEMIRILKTLHTNPDCILNMSRQEYNLKKDVANDMFYYHLFPANKLEEYLST